MEFQKPVRVIAFADLDKLGWQLDKNQRTRRLGVLLVTASELTGDPFWLCVCLDESALAYRRKNLVCSRRLRQGRVSRQCFVVARRCAVQHLCKRNHFNRGVGAQVGIEY